MASYKGSGGWVPDSDSDDEESSRPVLGQGQGHTSADESSSITNQHHQLRFSKVLLPLKKSLRTWAKIREFKEKVNLSISEVNLRRHPDMEDSLEQLELFLRSICNIEDAFVNSIFNAKKQYLRSYLELPKESFSQWTYQTEKATQADCSPDQYEQDAINSIIQDSHSCVDMYLRNRGVALREIERMIWGDTASNEFTVKFEPVSPMRPGTVDCLETIIGETDNSGILERLSYYSEFVQKRRLGLFKDIMKYQKLPVSGRDLEQGLPSWMDIRHEIDVLEDEIRLAGLACLLADFLTLQVKELSLGKENEVEPLPVDQRSSRSDLRQTLDNIPSSITGAWLGLNKPSSSVDAVCASKREPRSQQRFGTPRTSDFEERKTWEDFERNSHADLDLGMHTNGNFARSSEFRAGSLRNESYSGDFSNTRNNDRSVRIPPYKPKGSSGMVSSGSVDNSMGCRQSTNLRSADDPFRNFGALGDGLDEYTNYGITESVNEFEPTRNRKRPSWSLPVPIYPFNARHYDRPEHFRSENPHRSGLNRNTNQTRGTHSAGCGERGMPYPLHRRPSLVVPQSFCNPFEKALLSRGSRCGCGNPSYSSGNIYEYKQDLGRNFQTPGYTGQFQKPQICRCSSHDVSPERLPHLSSSSDPAFAMDSQQSHLLDMAASLKAIAKALDTLSAASIRHERSLNDQQTFLASLSNRVGGLQDNVSEMREDMTALRYLINLVRTDVEKSQSSNLPRLGRGRGLGLSGEDAFRNIEVPDSLADQNYPSAFRRMNISPRRFQSFQGVPYPPEPLENNELASDLPSRFHLEDSESLQRSSSTGNNLMLNNQVPPGNRANNYWDNFKSYSRQNMLSTSKVNIPSNGISPSGSETRLSVSNNIEDPCNPGPSSSKRSSRTEKPCGSGGNSKKSSISENFVENIGMKKRNKDQHKQRHAAESHSRSNSACAGSAAGAVNPESYHYSEEATGRNIVEFLSAATEQPKSSPKSTTDDGSSFSIRDRYGQMFTKNEGLPPSSSSLDLDVADIPGDFDNVTHDNGQQAIDVVEVSNANELNRKTNGDDSSNHTPTLTGSSQNTFELPLSRLSLNERSVSAGGGDNNVSSSGDENSFEDIIDQWGNTNTDNYLFNTPTLIPISLSGENLDNLNPPNEVFSDAEAK